MVKRRSRRIRPADTDDDKMRMKEQHELDADYKASIAREADSQTSLELIYGKPGVPVDDPHSLPAPRQQLTLVDVVARDKDEKARQLPTVPEILQAVKDKVDGPKKTHRVTVVKDHVFVYPDLYLDIHIHGPSWEEPAFADMFARARCRRAQSMESADLVVFTGGVDVDPQLYGASRHPMTERAQPDRDGSDMEMYVKCLHMGVPMLGVCRGAQFLSVMQGGKLYQHVDNHNGTHSMFDHHTKQHIEKVSSVHHQMVMPNEGMEVLATAAKSTVRHIDDKVKVEGTNADIEAFYYRDAAILGIQGHPEYRGYPAFTKWALDMINELFVCSPDVKCINGNYRVRPDLLEERLAVK